MNKVSVIVPVYNGELYLCQCLDSLKAQTYQNLEIIIVDDGSRDRSGELAEKYALADERIVTIHQSNQGLSRARTTGLEKATGDYVGFVDSDDWCAPKMFETLVVCMETKNADMSVCGYKSVTKIPPDQIEDEVSGIQCYSSMEYMDLLCCHEQETFMWNKLFRRELLRENWIPFSKERFGEDMSIMYRLGTMSHKIAVSDAICYYYYQNDTGICATETPYKYQSYLDILTELDTFYETHENPLQLDRYRLFLLLRAYVELQKYCVGKNLNESELEKKIYTRFVKIYRKMAPGELRKDKMYLKMFLMRFHLMGALIRIRGTI